MGELLHCINVRNKTNKKRLSNFEYAQVICFIFVLCSFVWFLDQGLWWVMNALAYSSGSFVCLGIVSTIVSLLCISISGCPAIWKHHVSFSEKARQFLLSLNTSLIGIVSFVLSENLLYYFLDYDDDNMLSFRASEWSSLQGFIPMFLGVFIIVFLSWFQAKNRSVSFMRQCVIMWPVIVLYIVSSFSKLPMYFGRLCDKIYGLFYQVGIVFHKTISMNSYESYMVLLTIIILFIILYECLLLYTNKGRNL